jgi:formamidopyrimidine-DNA glycosylase
MPELPEIYTFARDMHKELVGRVIATAEVLQPKCLNVPVEEFQDSLSGAEILEVSAHGKWVQVRITPGWLLLGLGMGGEILLTDRSHLPQKHRLILDFEGGDCLAINFWWFSYAHFVEELAERSMVSRIGPDFMSMTQEELRDLLRGRREGLKPIHLNRKQIAGIGNLYGQPRAFKAAVHLLQRMNTLSDDRIDALWQAIRDTLQESIDLGGSHWEQNLYGEHGKWDSSFFLVGYREGKPCPTCGTAADKIKTGSTSTHICPQCQQLGAE